MTKKYMVTLTEEERKFLRGILNKGKQNAQKRKRAQALLLADDKITDEEIAERAGMHRRGIENLRQRFVEEGFEVTLEGKPKGHRSRIIQGADEARLIALTCSKKPDGYDHWTLRLLSDTFVTLDNKKVSYEAIRQTLKKTLLNHGKSESGVYRRKKTQNS
jgi:transposase